MTSTESPDQAADAARSIARLERRLERERRARREAEEIADRGMRELWLVNQELDRRVAERTADLEQTLRELAVASSSRERFLSTLSHETRTPLNGLLGMLELLTPHVEGTQAADYLATATRSADRLRQLLTRLLDLVELGSGNVTPELEPVELGELADSIRKRWQLTAMRTGHLLAVSSSHEARVVNLDERRVLQILDELLDNAVTHGDRGTVNLDISISGEELRLEITDAGPGIDADRIEGLFDDFTMLDASAARISEGLGLGLGLCQQLAEALDGRLTITNDGCGHTVATLVLPTNR